MRPLHNHAAIKSNVAPPPYSHRWPPQVPTVGPRPTSPSATQRQELRNTGRASADTAADTLNRFHLDIGLRSMRCRVCSHRCNRNSQTSPRRWPECAIRRHLCRDRASRFEQFSDPAPLPRGGVAMGRCLSAGFFCSMVFNESPMELLKKPRIVLPARHVPVFAVRENRARSGAAN